MLAEGLLQDVLITADRRNEDVLKRAFAKASKPPKPCKDDYNCKCSPHWKGPHSGIIHDLLTVQPMTGGMIRANYIPIIYGSSSTDSIRIIASGSTSDFPTCDLHHRLDCPTCA